MTTKTFFFACAMLMIAGCVNLGPNQSLTTQYQLNTSSHLVKASNPTNLILLVTEPKPNPGYGHTDMIYINKTYQFNRFANSRWVDSPARMLVPLMVQSLQNTKRFKAVVANPYAGSADLRLDTELLSLQQEFFQKPSQIRFALRAQLINLNTQRIIATKQFEVVENAPQDSPYGGVVAANRAVSDLMTQLVNFVIKSN